MEHKIDKSLTNNATWERRVEVLREAIYPGKSRDYAFLTACMAHIEAKDSNDYDRAKVLGHLKLAIMDDDLKRIEEFLEELEELNHE